MNDQSGMPVPEQPVSEADKDKAAEASLPVPQEFEAEKTFKLSRPVLMSNPGGSGFSHQKEITLRAPIAKDVFAIGGTATRTEWLDGGRMVVEQNSERLLKYICRLSGQDASVIDNLPARDLKLIYDWLNRELSAVGN